MSFNSNPSRVEYVANTTATTFTFNFTIFNAEDVMVYKIPVGVTPDDKQHLLTLADYKVSINNTAGGFIELYNAPTVGDNIIIQRKLKIDRATDFVNNGGIYSDVLNGDQDYQTYLIGDLQNNQEKFLKIPTTLIGFNTQIPVPKPNGILQISTDGTSMEFNTDIGEHVRNVSNNIDSVNNISNSLPTINTIEDNLTIIQSISTNMNDVKLAASYADEIKTNTDYVRNARESMMDPTGYNHDHPHEQGILELCTPNLEDPSTVIIYGINYDRTPLITRIVPKASAAWLNGISIDTNKKYQLAQTPHPSTPITWWISGQKYTKTTIEVIEIPELNGAQYIYRDDQSLKTTTEIDRQLFIKNAYTCYIYLNLNEGRKIVFADERHGINVSGGTHYMHHFTAGFKYIKGYDFNGLIGNTPTYDSFSIGTSFDEDLERNTPIQINTPFIYLNEDTWTITPTSNNKFGYIPENLNYVAFNNLIDDKWQLSEVSFVNYMLIHFFLTNNDEYPIMKVLGTQQYDNVTTASEAAIAELKSLIKNSLPTYETQPLYTIIIDAFGNIIPSDTGKLSIDWRTTNIISSQTTGDLLPDQTNKDGFVLQTTGSIVQWISPDNTIGGKQVSEEFIVPDNYEVSSNIELTVGSVNIDNFRLEKTYEIQPGEYKDFAMENPKGRWLFCDGREISRIDYKDLFEAIGTRYGEGDGVNTFNIPNLMGMFKRTIDYSNKVDKIINRPFGSFQNYDWKGFYLSPLYDNYNATNGHLNWQGKSTASVMGNSVTGYWSGGAGVGTGTQWDNVSEIRPVNISVYTCIRY